VPTKEVARWQYKTVLIIFPLNLQTITIPLDVVKWKGREVKIKEMFSLIPSKKSLGVEFIGQLHARGSADVI